MSNFSDSSYPGERSRKASSEQENLTGDKDLIMEQILENINSTPIGQVLKKIALLPDIRREKILDVRQQISEGRYNLNERLDVAVDKVLEDLTA